MARFQSIRDAFNKRRRPDRSGAPSGVLFIASGGLGDTIMLAHVIEQFLSLAETNEPITLLLRKDASKTGFLMPNGIEIETVDFNALRSDQDYRNDTANRLYRRNYRMAVSLDYLRHPRLDEFLLTTAQANNTIAMRAKPWPKYQSELARTAAILDTCIDTGPAHVDKMLRWANFASALTGLDPRPFIARISDGRLAASSKKSPPFIMAQAFSAVNDKQIAPEIWADVLDCLPQGWCVVFTGAPGEDAANPEFSDIMARPNVSYDDRLFEDLVPDLRAAKFAISVDTAFMHLAIAVGTPTLGLASAAYVGEIVPYAPEITPDNARFLYHDIPCRGCLGDCSLPQENGRYPCIARLEPALVRQAVFDLIKQTQPDT